MGERMNFTAQRLKCGLIGLGGWAARAWTWVNSTACCFTTKKPIRLMNGVGVGANAEDNKGENSRSRDHSEVVHRHRDQTSTSARTHCAEGRARKATVPLSWIMSGRVLTAERAGREGTREKREPVVKVVLWSPSSESGDDGGPTSRRLSKGCATRTKWPSSYRGGAEEALEDEKHILELGVRSTKVRVIRNIIIEKLKTAGAETCPTHGGPGGSKLKNQLHLTAGGHETTSCRHVSPHVSAQ
ncbi:hypothetical protein B0H13DRAFT_1913952 [Mycena leptocephala]|nr:hypothetical protein B0H13DRAFT_1913952 [Mycena leptocephala]